MKYRILHIAILILFGIISFSSFSQESGPESFIENISIPGGAITDGINPEDIIFADNKYFVAGLGTVLVLNDEFTVVNTIHLSERGQYGYDAYTIVYNNPGHSLMAYDGEHMLFVISPDNEICMINTTGNGSLDTTRIPKPDCVPFHWFTESILRYDPVNDRLFWVINWDEYGDPYAIPYSYIGCFSASTPYANAWGENVETVLSPNVIYDIKINDSFSYYYLARQSTIDVRESNASEFNPTPIVEIASVSQSKKLLYVHDDEFLRTYCISNTADNITYVDWIDGNNYNLHEQFQALISPLYCMTYNAENDQLFLGGGQSAFVYTRDDPQYIATVILSGDYPGETVYNLECFGEVIYASKPSELILIDGDDYTTDIALSKKNNFFGTGAYNPDPDPNKKSVVITNMEGASLEIFNFQGHENVLTGVSIYKSCYNPDYQKFYFYSNEIRDNSKIAIIQHNANDNSYSWESAISYDYFGSDQNISSCCYNEAAHHLLISSYFQTNHISKRNGSDNSDAGYLDLERGYCENIFITPQPNSKIFCATAMNSLSDASIEIYNAGDYSYVTTLDGLDSGYEGHEFKTDFCYNSKDNDVYFILYPRDNIVYGKIIRIDLDNGCSMDSLWDLNAIPEKIAYSVSCNKIYIKYRSQEYITEFICDDLLDPINDEYFDFTVNDIDCDNNLNFYYVLTAGDSENPTDHVFGCRCSGISDPYLEWEVPMYSSSIRYNDLNGRIYVYSLSEHYFNNESHLSILDHDDYEEEVDDLYLHNSQCQRYASPYFYNELTVDPVTGYLLIPNGSHSNISVIRCPEKFELTNKINWISFPRFDRNPLEDAEISSVVALTNRIIPGQSYTGHMYYHDNALGMTSVDKNGISSPWSTSLGLVDVYSNRGYQLSLEPDQKSLYFYGQIQDPGVPVELEGTSANRFCNYVGYYLTYPQNPFDAIPANILEDLRFMAGQYWSCVFNDPIRGNPSPGCWRCAINQGKLEVNYGDMVKLTSVASNTFLWQQNNANGPSIEKLKAESFDYIDQYDYEAIFIELDTNDMPSEIGAFAGDSCVGATKVLPGDTTVLVCAYTEGYEGDDITFEFSYATKAARTDKPDYFVEDPRTGKSERRLIKAGENQPYHFVSFKLKDESQINTVSTGLNCYPNPASESFSVSYYLPEDAYVKLELLNPLGIVVFEKQLGYQTEGNHACDIQSIGLPVGYYFVRIYTADQFYTGTLLINH